MEIRELRIKMAGEYTSHIAKLEGAEQWLQRYADNQAFLYRVHDWLVTDKGDELTDTDSEIVYKKLLSSIWVKGQDFSFQCNRDNMKRIVEGSTDLLTPLLPLGTIVDLKKEHLADIFPADKINQLRFMIDYRYSFYDTCSVYLPYGGIVYPLGRIGEAQVLYFTPQLVEKVVYMGFQDEMETAYEVEMKKELILQKGMKSLAFANGEEKRQFQQQVKTKEGKQHGV